MAGKKIKVGILGQGRSGRGIHGGHISSLPELFEITAVSDPIPFRREYAAREYGCDVHEDYREILGRKDIELVVNALPSHLHVPVTLEVIEAGFNVICEKPLARRVSEVDRLMEAAARSKKMFTVYQQSRYGPLFQQVKKVVESGVLGRLVQVSLNFNGFSRRWDWQTIQDFNGGNLLNTGPHPLDQALLLMKPPVVPQVNCVMDRVNTLGDAEDFVKLVMVCPERPLVDIEISSCCPYPTPTYNIHASRGGLKASGNTVEWKYFDPREAPPLKLHREPISKEDGTPCYPSDSIPWKEESWKVPEKDSDLFHATGIVYYEMVYRHLREGGPVPVRLEEVRTLVAVTEECHRQNVMERMRGEAC